MRKFEYVIDSMKRTDGDPKLPTRADKGSAGYDFYAPTDYTAKPNEVVKIWTDVKASMNEDEVLLIDVRSSMGGKYRLANTIGVIDSTYYSNKDNDGNIGIFLINTTKDVMYINKGDRIAQGIFLKYLVTDDDAPLSDTRNGGFGSTGR